MYFNNSINKIIFKFNKITTQRSNRNIGVINKKKFYSNDQDLPFDPKSDEIDLTTNGCLPAMSSYLINKEMTLGFTLAYLFFCPV